MAVDHRARRFLSVLRRRQHRVELLRRHGALRRGRRDHHRRSHLPWRSARTRPRNRGVEVAALPNRRTRSGGGGLRSWSCAGRVRPQLDWGCVQDRRGGVQVRRLRSAGRVFGTCLGGPRRGLRGDFRWQPLRVEVGQRRGCEYCCSTWQSEPAVATWYLAI